MSPKSSIAHPEPTSGRRTNDNDYRVTHAIGPSREDHSVCDLARAEKLAFSTSFLEITCVECWIELGAAMRSARVSAIEIELTVAKNKNKARYVWRSIFNTTRVKKENGFSVIEHLDCGHAIEWWVPNGATEGYKAPTRPKRSCQKCVAHLGIQLRAIREAEHQIEFRAEQARLRAEYAADMTTFGQRGQETFSSFEKQVKEVLAAWHSSGTLQERAKLVRELMKGLGGTADVTDEHLRGVANGNAEKRINDARD